MKMTTGRLSARSGIAKNISRACAALAAMGLAGVCLPAQAWDIFNVGGTNNIGDTTLTTSAGVATPPSYWSTTGQWDSDGLPVHYSSLTSPTLTVSNAGTVTLKFKHRYDFEDAPHYDGGAVFISTNGGTPFYLNGSAFSANGYNGDDALSLLFGGVNDFEYTSTGWATGEHIESIASLGAFNVGDTIAVIFSGGWDANWTGSPSSPCCWEISTVEVSDTGSTLLNVDFLNGRSGFTVTNDPTTIEGPWKYQGGPICQFELNATAVTSDRFVPDTPGTVIDLTGAKLKVIVLTGTLSGGQAFSLFDLSGGSTLAGTYSSFELPTAPAGAAWDSSGLAAGGNGRIALVCGDTWQPTAAGTYEYTNNANWAIAYPDSAGCIASFNIDLAGAQTVNLSKTITLGGIKLGDQGSSYNAMTIAGNGGSLVLDVADGSAVIERSGGNDVTDEISADIQLNDNLIVSDANGSDSDPGQFSLQLTGAISGFGKSVTKNGNGAVTLSGVSTYSGGTTVNGGWFRFNPSSIGTGPLIINGNDADITDNWQPLNGNEVIINGDFRSHYGFQTGTGPIKITRAGIKVLSSVDIQGVVTDTNGLNSLNALDINLGGINGWGAFPTISSDVTMRSNQVMTHDSGWGLCCWFNYFTGVISDGGYGYSLTKAGTAMTVLTAANTYSGDTIVTDDGALAIDNNLALQYSALVTAAGKFGITSAATTPTIGGLKGSTDLISTFAQGNGDVNKYGSVTALTLNPVSGTCTYSGVIADGATGMTLTKTGDGTQVLEGTNTYTGATTVNAGVLRLTHPLALATNTSMNLDGGTLDLAFSGTLKVSAASTNGVPLGVGLYSSNSIPLMITSGGYLLVGNPLVADFTPTPGSGPAPLDVVFTDMSFSALGTITNWFWDFGNGVTTNYTSAIATLTNNYTLWGTYPIQLVISDNAGFISTNNTISITVTQPLAWVVSSPDQLASVPVNIGPNTLTFSNGVTSAAVGGLTGKGSLALTNAGSDCVTLVIGGNGPDTKFEGALTGCGGLTKVGSNMFTLSSTNNTYAGDTIVSNGTLKLAGAASLPVTSGLQLWLDASDAATLFTDVGGTTPVSTSGDTVKCWKDKSGNTGRDLSNDSTPPTYQTGQIGGLSVVHFNGAQNLDNSYSSGTPYSIFSVSRLSGSQNGRLITANVNNWLLGYHGGQINRFFFEGWVNESGSTADTSTHFFSATGSGSLSTVYDLIGGTTPLASNGNGTQAPNGLNLGGSTYGEYSKGDVGEVLIYNRVLESSDIASIRDYFTAKWISGGGGGAGNILPTNTILRLVSPGVLNLAGGTNTVAALYLNGAHQVAGTWGATGSGADHVNDDFFSGTGLLVVMTLPAPTGLTAQALNERVNLTWSAVSEATSYLLSRASTSNGAPDATFPTAALTYLDTGLINGTEYWYAVAATNNSGPGANSEWVAATPQAPTPPSFLPGSGITHVDPITGHATIAFGVTSNWYYRIVYKDDLLTGDWLPVQPPTNGWHTATNSGIMTLIDTNTAGGVTQRFYRIEMQ